MIMERSVKYIELLLSCQINELDSVTGYTDREVSILRLLRMLHSIDEFFPTEYVHVQMMSALVEVTIEDVNQLILSLILIMAK